MEFISKGPFFKDSKKAHVCHLNEVKDLEFLDTIGSSATLCGGGPLFANLSF